MSYVLLTEILERVQIKIKTLENVCVLFIVKCRTTWNNMFYLKKIAPWLSCNRCPKFREIWFHRPAVISLSHPIQLMLPWSWTNSAHQPLAGSLFLRKYVICKVMELDLKDILKLCPGSTRYTLIMIDGDCTLDMTRG